LNGTDSPIGNNNTNWPSYNSTDSPSWNETSNSPIGSNSTDWPSYNSTNEASWNSTDFQFGNETEASWNSTDFQFGNETEASWNSTQQNGAQGSSASNENAILNNLLPLLQNLTQIMQQQHQDNQAPVTNVVSNNGQQQSNRVNITLSIAVA
jgi:hypothetical protein